MGLLERLRLAPLFELLTTFSGEEATLGLDEILGVDGFFAEEGEACSRARAAAARSASLRHFLSIRAASSAALFSAFSRLRSEEERMGAAEEASVIVSLRSEKS